MYQTKVGRLLWAMVVCCCFLVAGTLINNSYSDWQESPIATTITTHPIAELDFPTVTVCPPRGSSTALNYDLMKADNDSMTEQDREDLIQEVYEVTIKQPHLEYAEKMIAASTAENLDEVYHGLQSIPGTYAEGFKIKVRKLSGSIRSPFYGEDYDESQYESSRIHQVVLEFPSDLAKQMGDGKLVVELEVDVREEEGWVEEVRYIKGPRYKLYNDSEKTWNEAEEHCTLVLALLISTVSTGQLHNTFS